MKDWIVLIVDDELDNLNVARKVLSFNDAQVFDARNGREGLAALADISPTFILLDLSMPEMDGWEMFRILREQPETQGIPVIALTAHAMAGDREKVLEAGFNGYIAKPFRIDSFLEEIHRCLDEFSSAR
ncbi:MAG: response regulator [Anaerolineae bacterium]|nr:response regulator [Anaerolineae bacterium]MCA9894421.1 response regulator [Anaerolineae bacterium]